MERKFIYGSKAIPVIKYDKSRESKAKYLKLTYRKVDDILETDWVYLSQIPLSHALQLKE